MDLSSLRFIDMRVGKRSSGHGIYIVALMLHEYYISLKELSWSMGPIFHPIR